MPRSADSTVESVASSTPGSTRISAPLTSISITPPSLPAGDDICGEPLCAGATQPGSTPGAGGPTRLEAWCLNPCGRRDLGPPHRVRPADNARAPSDLGSTGAFLESL